MIETNKIMNGDALMHLKELPDSSINCCMTSPPYWALRDYGSSVETIWDGDKDCKHEWIIERTPRPNGGGTSSEKSFTKRKGVDNFQRYVDNKDRASYSDFCFKCNAWKGQLGLEPTFDLYIKHLCDIFDEVKRVLRKDGTCWINLGDTYIGSPSGLSNEKAEEWANKGDGLFNRLHRRNTNDMTSPTTPKPRNEYPDPKNPASIRAREQVPKQSVPDKCLAQIPFRFSIEMVNRGWILRNTIIWHKPNCMPSSVKDRFTVDFEYLFFFVKSRHYFFETQYEPLKESTLQRCNYGNSPENKMYKSSYAISPEGYDTFSSKVRNGELEGRNKRAVWTITTKPFSEAHFATYPEELCETPIKAGCPEFVCNKCGKPREKIIKTDNPSQEFMEWDENRLSGAPNSFQTRQCIKSLHRNNGGVYSSAEFKGYSDCGCNAGFSGGIVLDPFFGAGTTGLVALKQNKKFIGIELNPEYIKIAKERLRPFLEQTKLCEAKCQ